MNRLYDYLELFFRFYRMDFCLRNLGLGLIGIASAHRSFDWTLATITLLQILLVQMHSFSSNDYYDNLLWSEENAQQLTRKRGYGGTARFFLTVLPLFFLVLSASTMNRSILLLVAYVFLFYLYQAPPYRLKDHWLASLFLNAFCLGTVLFLFPYFRLNGSIDSEGIGLALIFFFSLCFHETVHQIAHYGRDRIHSIVDAFGMKISRSIAVVFLLVPGFVALMTMLFAGRFIILFLPALFFSLYRCNRLIRMGSDQETFKGIRNRFDKFYTIQEGMSYLVIAGLNHLIR